jgi:hypothetical protein
MPQPWGRVFFPRADILSLLSLSPFLLLDELVVLVRCSKYVTPVHMGARFVGFFLLLALVVRLVFFFDLFFAEEEEEEGDEATSLLLRSCLLRAEAATT